ncbi:diguanylate cyclase domain-containing protein [Pseudomarimonas salicorniae]|uniref:diguanylate cyclase domain-containing protein n=1 Tax=Pseudomarimonas salicorniae TaxID=2933270 RepID=UPI002004F6DF
MSGPHRRQGLLWPIPALFSLWPLAAAAGDYLGLQRYTLRDGLPQLTVTSMALAPAGPIWVGTQEGLARFDGQSFDVFRHQPGEPSSLASSSVDALAVDAQQRLWIGTNDQGVEVRDLQRARMWRLSTGDGLAHPTVSQLRIYGPGAIAGTPRGFDRLQLDPPALEPLVRGVEAAGLAVLAGLPYGLDRDCGLWRLDPLPAVRIDTELPEQARCVALAASPEGLWIASPGHGLLRLTPDGSERQHWSTGTLGAEAPPSALLPLRDGGLVIGFEDGSLSRLATARAARAVPLRTSQPVGSRINSLFEPASGGLWVGTHASGLLRAGALSPALDAGPPGQPGLSGWPRRLVYSVWRDETDILVGTADGLLRRRSAAPDWEPVEAIGARSVRRILPAAEGGWWIGTLDGLWHLAPEGATRQVESLVDSRISDLLYADRRLWVATRDGLCWMEGERCSQDGVPEPLKRGFLTVLLRDTHGHLWVGSNEGGIFVLMADGGLRRLHRGNGRLTTDSVWALHEAGPHVYAGTHGGGLQRLRLDEESAWHLGLREGMSNNVVYRIEPDPQGRLWLSTNRGLNRVDPGSRRVEVLGASDGLANTEYNAGASFRDAQGRLYFGGTEGLDVIDPLAVPDTSSQARPLLAQLQAIGRDSRIRGGSDPDWQAIALGGPQRFAWDQRLLAATLVAIDFSAPDAARLRYRLIGPNGDGDGVGWIEPVRPRSEVLLAGLRHGDYRLEMQAAGRDGRFGPAVTQRMSIDPPPWASLPAQLLYLMTAGAVLAWMWRRHRRLARAKEARLEQLNRLVAQRTADLESANRQLRQSNAQLDRAGRTDPLTGASNRRDLHEWLESRQEAVLVEARAGGPRLLFCLLDLDDFKQINDSLGHRAGDEVLVAVASRLRELCRDQDLVVRWGGEEFLLVLQVAPAADLAPLLDRLLDKATAPVPLREHGSIEVGASIGIAAWPFDPALDAGDWEQSVILADRALYRAKAEGKQAWQLWCAGPALDARNLSDLLSGVEPERLPAGAVRILRSGRHAEP